eukprot:GEMP01059596.1.p1 GENE.GEMP01059596.1~~GEMP01059596.1.p1  ORF type:complete len:111 (-),score=6.72 GEMP01059596.1:868-1200(-)
MRTVTICAVMHKHAQKMHVTPVHDTLLFLLLAQMIQKRHLPQRVPPQREYSETLQFASTAPFSAAGLGFPVLLSGFYRIFFCHMQNSLLASFQMASITCSFSPAFATKWY